MFRKKLIIICLIMCLVCTVSAVSAADADDFGANGTLSLSSKDSVKMDDDQALLSVSPDGDVLGDAIGTGGTFSDLQTLVTGTTGTLTLTGNYTRSGSELSDGITINKDITIVGEEGKKIVLDANNNGRIFNIVGSDHTVTFKGITFINANIAAHGAAICSGNNYLVIDKCNFTDNYVSGSKMGAAIYGSSLKSVLINNSYFARNVNNNGHGGAISLDGTSRNLIINNTFFVNNTCSYQGGALYVASLDGASIINSNFTNNRAERGGAIRIQGTGKNWNLYNLKFTDNSARYEGGGVSHNTVAENFHYENVTFIHCYVREYSKADGGGGLYFNAKNSILNNITFINCSGWHGASLDIMDSENTRFNDILIINSSSRGQNSFGGAVVLRAGTGGGTLSGMILANVTIINSTSENHGGAIFVEGASTNAKISNIRIVNSSAKNKGGAICIVGSGATLTNIEITNSSAKIDGGAIYTGGAGSTFNNVTIRNSSAANNGGAIIIEADTQRFNNCSIDGATAHYGGGIYTTDKAFIYLTGCTVNNTYAYNGGGLYYGGSTGTVLWVDNCTFTNNNASHNGGAVYYVADKTDASNPVIYRDYNDFEGDGVKDANNRTTVTMHVGMDTYTRITNSYFENNTDYLYNVSAESDDQTVAGIVEVFNPKDPLRSNFELTIVVTKDGVNVASITLNTPADYDEYFKNGKFYVKFRDNLTKNATYNITVGFKDANYMYKEYTSSFKTKDTWEKGDFLILQDLINANYGTTLVLEDDYEFTSFEEYGTLINEPDRFCMNITDSITIDGQGHTLNAKGFSRIFNITGDNVILINIKFVNGDANATRNPDYGDGINKGGAIFWSGKNGLINDSMIGYNFAEYGAGIYLNQSAENNKIANSTFISNIANRNGGAIDCYAPGMNLTNTLFEENEADTGAALCREATATGGFGINNTFIKNRALTNGSALAWMSAQNITINSYVFINNTAGYSGGAIYVGKNSDNCTVINSYFEGNNVTSIDQGHGGAIEWYAGNGTIRNSTFIENNAYQGGAIFVGDESKKIEIFNSTFSRNNAYENGGAINVEGSNVTVNLTTFTDNTALEGGAIYVGGSGESNYVHSSVFEGNNATGGRGGAIDWVVSAGQIIDSNFTKNLAQYGGGVYIGGNSSNSRIENVRFVENSAVKNGGAIDWNATGGQLYNTTFISNYAGEYGAALCREANATGGSGKNNTFISNHAGISGAALGWINVKKIGIVNYTFINNTADFSGGAIYIGAGSDNCSIYNSTFKGNHITSEDGGHGGAIDVVADNATIINSTFEDNYAFYGGAVFVGSASGHTVVTNDTFRKNRAVVSGGAIHLQASGVDVNKSRFYYNTASNGSALYVGGEGTNNSVVLSLFEGNDATEYGAGIYWVASAGQIKDTNFTKNTAMYGGGIYLNGKSGNTNITNSIFRENNATKNGGAIECNASNVGIYNLLFEKNYAGEYGAALCRESGATSGHGDHNTFNYNHAGIAGAALAWMGVENIHIDYYNFTGNTANEHGGAIYVAEGSDYCVINHSRFIGNNITNLDGMHTGGAIDINALNATIVNSIFENNHAVYGGAVAAGENSGFTKIRNVTFERNGASIDGGAVNLRAFGGSLNDTRFYSNTAVRNGGAVYVGGTGKTNGVYSSLFDDNRAGDHGGAIDWRAAAGHILDSNFTRNSADYGGGIYLNGVSSGSVIYHAIFESNTAVKNGGAIDCNATLMNLTHTLFTSNYADFGAALCREAGATGGFGLNNTFDKNHAYTSGAALAWLGVSDIKINNYTFTNNTADYSGGAIYVSDDSDNCKVHNCTFQDNYVTSAISGRGGAIDWIGNNGEIINTTFDTCVALEGGAIYVADTSDNMTIINSSFDSCKATGGNGGALELRGDNVTIKLTNFTSCFSLKSGGAIAPINSDNLTISSARFISCVSYDFGGAIAGTRSNNANITDSFFKFNHGAGHTNPDGTLYGEGGAIYWGNSVNLTVSDSIFWANNAYRSGGSISADNVNNSLVSNIKTYNETAEFNGGSIAWLNSRNVTIENSLFNDSGSNYAGGSIYLDNVDNITVKNSLLNSTWASWGFGGGIYVGGNVTLNNITLRDGHDYHDDSNGIYFAYGNSTLVNSTFKETTNVIYIARGPTGINNTVYLINNTVRADNPNKNVTHMNNQTYKYYDYAVWNEGVLYLDGNDFDYVIFNNGTIMTHTITYVLDGQEHNVTWNTTFTFWANITDDDGNTIISAHSFNTTNDNPSYAGAWYMMDFNEFTSNVYLQGKFDIGGHDLGLRKNDVVNGTVYIKMPLGFELNVINASSEDVLISVKITPKVASNYTLAEEFVHLDIDGDLKDAEIIYTNATWYEGKIVNWTVAYANFTVHHLHVGLHTITATLEEDDNHFGCFNRTDFALYSRSMWIHVNASDIVYGQQLIVNVTSNATKTENGRIRIFINGQNVTGYLRLAENGTYMLYYNETLDPGEYQLAVVFTNGTYYGIHMNSSSFRVYALNTTVNATPTTPIKLGDKETITVDVKNNSTIPNKIKDLEIPTPSGYVKVTVDGEVYYKKLDENGHAVINIYELTNKTYTNVHVAYEGDAIFNGNYTLTEFTVGATDKYNITVIVNNITYGENATIYVILPSDVTKNLTVYVNDTKYENVAVKDGVAKLVVPNLACGDYVVNVTYPGGDKYARKDNNGNAFSVSKSDDWTLNLTVEAHEYKEYSIFDVTLPSNVEKNINLTIDDKNYLVILTDGAGQLRLNNLSAGFHTVVANYTGDSNYTAKTNSTAFYVDQIASTIAITNSSTSVIATVTTGATGTVTFYVNGKNRTVDIVGNVASWNDVLEIGNNTVVAVYNGDKNYTVSQNSKNFTIPKNKNSKVNVTAGNVTYGNASEIIVEVPKAQTGYVRIVVNGTDINVTVEIKEGVAKFNATGLDVGKYMVNVTYLGNEIYDVVVNSTNFTVSKANLKASAVAQNVTVKDNVTFVLSVKSDFSGFVNITKDAIKYYTGYPDALIDIGKLPAGDYTVNVTFYGDKNYNDKVIEVNFTVSRVVPIINVTINDVTYPNKAVALIDVSDYANGTINITVDGKHFNGTVENGHVEIDLTGLSAGAKTELINFTATDNYHLNATATYKSYINKAESSVVISNETRSVIATVTTGATGTVTFYVNGKNRTVDITGNAARWDDVLEIGNNAVVAVYNGDKNYTVSQNSKNFTIPKNTDAKVNVTAGNVTYGNASEIIVEVPKAQTGFVRIVVNGTDINVTVEIKEGIAKFNATGLNVGKYMVNVTYLGNEIYDIRANSTDFTVSKANLTASAVGQNVTVRDNIIFILSVADDFTGKVRIVVEGETYDGDVKTIIEMGKLLAGNKEATVTFYGDDNYNDKVIKPAFTVSAVTPSINVTIADTTYPNNTTAVVKVSDGATGTVEIRIGNKTFTKAISGGETTIDITDLDAGVKEAFVKFISSDDYNLDANATYKFVINKTESHITINVTPEDLYVGDKAVINITVSCTGEAIVYIDDVKAPYVLDNNKIIIDKTGLNPGKHTVVVYYPGDNNYESSSESYTFTVDKRESKVNVTAENTPYRQAVEITVQAPAEQTGYVTITVNNKNYTGKLEKGIAKFNITGLSVDEYDVEVTYLGNENYTGNHNATSFNVTSIELNPTVIGLNVTKSTNVTFIIVVPEDYTGHVSISVDGQTYVGDVETVIEMAKLSVGNKVADVEFFADNNYKGTKLKVNFTVSESSETLVVTAVVENSTVVVTVPKNATGNVTVILPDGSNTTVNVTNGSAVIKLENLTPGTQNITIIYSGDENYTGVTIYTNVTAPKYDSEVKVNVTSIKEGETAYIKVNVTENATGSVIVHIDGKEYPAMIDGSGVIVPVENLTAGLKTVVVEYSGDGNYSSNYTISKFTVEKGKSDVEPVVVDLGNGTVVVVVGDNATGNVTIVVDGQNFTGEVINGTAVVTIENITPGTHDIEVIYSGDGNHTNTTVPAEITVPKYDTVLNVTVSDIVNGTAVVTVEVPANATGNVSVRIDGMNYTGVIDGGKAVINLENLTGGAKTFIVEYPGDDNYNANYTVGEFVAEGVKPTVEPVVVDCGNGTVVVVIGDNATGNVTIVVDGQNFTGEVINGTAVITVENVTPGTHEIEVIYSGDGNHTNSTITSEITVPKYDTVLNVTVSDIVNGTAVVTVEVPANATGNVSVRIDGMNYTGVIDGGKAVINLENLTGGAKTFIVEYPGDDNYNANYTVGEFVAEGVKQIIEPVVVDYGNGTIAVVIGDNATGEVTVNVGNHTYNANVTDGIAIVNIENETPGTYDIEVIYSGDDSHAPSAADATITIKDVTPDKNDTPIHVDVRDIGVGDAATIIVTVPEDATGYITIEIDGIPRTQAISKGIAKFTVENLKAGYKTVAVSYIGDENFKANFTTAQFTVSKVASSVSAEITDANVGDNVIITVTVPEDATGTVLIDIDGVGYYVNVTDGKGTAEIPRIPSGIYQVNLTYMGDDKYLPSYNNSTFNVNKVESFVIPVANTIYVGDIEVIELIVPTDATGNVTVIIDGHEYVFNIDEGVLKASGAGDEFIVAVSGGRGILLIPNLPVGEYTVSVKYNGDAKYLPNVNSTDFKVLKKGTEMEITDLGNGTVIVRLPDNATGNVTVKVGNNTYPATVVNGTAVINIDNETPGVHDITVIYSGDDTHGGSVAEATVTIPKYETPIKVEAVDIYVGDTEVVSVSLPDGATGIVTIEINGRQYNTTIEGGKAVFEIDGLAYGNKTVAVKYAGDENYLGNTTTGQFTVSKRSSAVDATAKDISVGVDEVIIANVPSDATGRVLVDINGVGYYGDVINGKAKIIVPELPSGKYAAVVTYEGDDKYLSSNTTVSFTVSKVKAPISADGDKIEYGQDATVIVHVPEDATGTVTIVIDGKTYTQEVSNGKAVFVISGLKKGDHIVTASYSGDKKYEANDTITDVDVYYNETPENPNGTDYDVPSKGISLANYETGNPIIMALLMLMAIGFANIRRFKK